MTEDFQFTMEKEKFVTGDSIELFFVTELDLEQVYALYNSTGYPTGSFRLSGNKDGKLIPPEILADGRKKYKLWAPVRETDIEGHFIFKYLVLKCRGELCQAYHKSDLEPALTAALITLFEEKNVHETEVSTPEFDAETGYFSQPAPQLESFEIVKVSLEKGKDGTSCYTVDSKMNISTGDAHGITVTAAFVPQGEETVKALNYFDRNKVLEHAFEGKDSLPPDIAPGVYNLKDLFIVDNVNQRTSRYYTKSYPRVHEEDYQLDYDRSFTIPEN